MAGGRVGVVPHRPDQRTRRPGRLGQSVFDSDKRLDLVKSGDGLGAGPARRAHSVYVARPRITHGEGEEALWMMLVSPARPARPKHENRSASPAGRRLPSGDSAITPRAATRVNLLPSREAGYCFKFFGPGRRTEPLRYPSLTSTLKLRSAMAGPGVPGPGCHYLGHGRPCIGLAGSWLASGHRM